MEIRVKWCGASARDRPWRLNVGGRCSYFNSSKPDVRIFIFIIRAVPCTFQSHTSCFDPRVVAKCIPRLFPSVCSFHHDPRTIPGFHCDFLRFLKLRCEAANCAGNAMLRVAFLLRYDHAFYKRLDDSVRKSRGRTMRIEVIGCHPDHDVLLKK